MTRSKLIIALYFCCISMLMAQPTSHRFDRQVDTVTMVKKGITTHILKNKEGQILQVIRLKNGIKEGFHEMYSNGKMTQKTMFKNGEMEGEQSRFFSNGKLNTKWHYQYNPEIKRSELHGLHQVFNEKGILLEEHHYKNNAKHGPFVIRDANTGKVKTKGTYDNNFYVGKFESFYPNGKKHEIFYYKLQTEGEIRKKSVLHGKTIAYQEDGSLQFSGTNVDGKIEGLYTKYKHKSPHLELVAFYKDGKIHGMYEHYHPNGKLRTKGTLYTTIEIDGKQMSNVYDGKNEEFYDTGTLKSLTHYKMGKLNGVWKQFYANEMLSEIRYYEDNLGVGVWEQFDDKGNKTSEIHYTIIEKDGKKESVKHGVEMRWVKNVCVQKTRFHFGLQEGLHEQFYNDGTLKERLFFKEGKLDKESYYYHPDGKLKRFEERIHPSDTVRRGHWIQNFHTDGVLTYKGFYEKDKRITESQFVDGQIHRWDLHDLLNVSYAPNGTVTSFQIAGLANRPIFEVFYYQNGAIRKMGFQDVETKSNTKVDVLYNGKISSIYTDNPTLEPLKASLMTTEKWMSWVSKDWVNSRLVTDSIKQGSYQLYWSNGNPFFKGHFENDKPHGDFVVFEPITKDTLIFRQFKNGLTVGKWIQKFGGKLDIHRDSFHENGKKDENTYFKMGIPQTSQKYDETGKRIWIREYFEDGRLRLFRNEITHLAVEYDKNGNKRYESVALPEKPDWLVKRYFHTDSKQLKSEAFYFQNKQDSSYVSYYPNGAIEFVLQYKEGKRNGTYESFLENGTTKSKGFYLDDKMHGEWLEWRKGVQTKVWYENDVAVVMPPEKSCGCTDTTMNKNSIKFANLLDNMVSWADFKPYIPKYIIPIDNFDFGSIFYINYQFSNSHTNGFSSMKLLFFKEIAFDVPAIPQMRVVLNPCITPGYLSNISANAHYSFNDPTDTNLSLDTKRVAIHLPTSPLKSVDPDYKAFTVLFNTQQLSLANENVKIFLAKEPEFCFSKGVINEFLYVEGLTAEPQILSSTPFMSPYETTFTNKKQNTSAFTGLDIQANVTFKWIDGGVEFQAEAKGQLRACNAWIEGTCRFDVEKISEDYFKLSSNKTSKFSLQNLKAVFLKNGIQTQLFYNEKSKQIEIQFYAE